MSADKNDNVKITVSCGKESTADANVSHTMPFLLGFIMGIVSPIVVVVIAANYGVEWFAIKPFCDLALAHYDPMIFVWLLAITTMALLLLYLIHCRYCVEMAKVTEKQQRSILEVKSGLAQKFLDVIAPKPNHLGKGEVFSVTVVTKTTESESTTSGGCLSPNNGAGTKINTNTVVSLPANYSLSADFT